MHVPYNMGQNGLSNSHFLPWPQNKTSFTQPDIAEWHNGRPDSNIKCVLMCSFISHHLRWWWPLGIKPSFIWWQHCHAYLPWAPSSSAPIAASPHTIWKPQSLAAQGYIRVHRSQCDLYGCTLLWTVGAILHLESDYGEIRNTPPPPFPSTKILMMKHLKHAESP